MISDLGSGADTLSPSVEELMMMTFRNILVVGILSSGVTATGFAHAQEADADTPAPTPALAPSPPNAAAAAFTEASPSPSSSDGHASGFMVQARMQTVSSLLSLGGGPGFLFGYQGRSFSLGLGLGLSRVGISAGGDTANLTLFQVAPTLTVDVWHSKDGRASANLVGSVGYARASVAATGHGQSCSFDGAGLETCSTSNVDDSASASLIPVMLGFGGDYFLSRNFALGAEFGLQGLFLAGVSSGSASSSSSSSSSVDAGADAEFAYGALRATLVLGD